MLHTKPGSDPGCLQGKEVPGSPLNKERWTGVSSLSVYLYHLSHVALGACVLSGVFNFHEHYKEQVVPHVVFLLDVLLKRHGLVVELVPFQTCRWAAQLC